MAPVRVWLTRPLQRAHPTELGPGGLADPTVDRCGVTELADPGIQADRRRVWRRHQRGKVPTAATMEIPAMASTPGIVVNRATVGSLSASRGEFFVHDRQLAAVEVQLA